MAAEASPPAGAPEICSPAMAAAREARPAVSLALALLVAAAVAAAWVVGTGKS
jgi:hypothetical protein